MTSAFQIVAQTDDLCGEAPVWVDERESLVWVDQGRKLVRDLAGGTPKVIVRGFAAGGIVPVQDGSLLLAGPDGLARLSLGGVFKRLPLDPLGAGCCLNDVCVGPDGELLAGVMALRPDGTDVSRAGALVRIENSGRVQTLDNDVMLPNGMAMSADGRWLYVVDSARRAVFRYASDELRGSSVSRSVLCVLSADDGVPDGLAVDAAGNVWLALWYGGQVVRVSPRGEVDLRVHLPFAQISSLAFGGRDRCDLYVTTAAEPWHSVFAPSQWSALAPQGGSLLRLRCDVPGAPVARTSWAFRPMVDPPQDDLP